MDLSQSEKRIDGGNEQSNPSSFHHSLTEIPGNLLAIIGKSLEEIHRWEIENVEQQEDKKIAQNMVCFKFSNKYDILKILMINRKRLSWKKLQFY